MPPNVIDFDAKLTYTIVMRRAILEHLGNNNVLVGFHAPWIFTALSLALPVCRVVYLGSEKAYLLFLFKVMNAFLLWKTLFMKRLTNSLDRRIPAVFCSDGIVGYYLTQHDFFSQRPIKLP